MRHLPGIIARGRKGSRNLSRLFSIGRGAAHRLLDLLRLLYFGFFLGGALAAIGSSISRWPEAALRASCLSRLRGVGRTASRWRRLRFQARPIRLMTLPLDFGAGFAVGKRCASGWMRSISADS